MKVGDRVICINVGLMPISANLTLGRSYTIISMNTYSDVIYIIDDSGGESGYYDYRFTNLVENRRLKLEKLKKVW